MEGDIMRLDSVLSLIVEECVGVVIPQSEWEKGSGGFRLTFVGRLPFDSDLCRGLDLLPWTFDWNLVVIQSLSPTANPLSVDLDWCPFFINVHDLSFAQRTFVVVHYIGKCLGAWLDVEDVGRYILWYDTDHFVDPGTKTPYGCSGVRWLGAHIFGDFRWDSIDSPWPEVVARGGLVGLASLQERLAKSPEQLPVKCGQKEAVLGRQLVDQSSASLGLDLREFEGNWPVGHLTSQTHIRPALGMTDDLVGSSLGRTENRPKSVNDPFFVSQPMPYLAGN
ncbi:hypothetical protein Salat_0250000 [Sesamum alatum]|uniref:Uncharacterized protein n=1 Tax=Sesamum alatum TaxID=300844 RepID=A0AAE1YZG1_9LAMI|nr:hypothetical protein Salat_0250000 [Sesamum alatum]